jgi:hypothetical protein
MPWCHGSRNNNVKHRVSTRVYVWFCTRRRWTPCRWQHHRSCQRVRLVESANENEIREWSK